MTKYIFKTSIHCAGCLKRVKPLLDARDGIQKWEVNLDHPDKILTVESDDLSASEITDIIDNAGFEIELIKSTNN
ncbi:MAG TPA: heavy-metal-associated domain-containing protein [Bacteroidales bacterium]|nr:heavy-metal-associated domain-containing protein [Bacteroidales bacterium]